MERWGERTELVASLGGGAVAEEAEGEGELEKSPSRSELEGKKCRRELMMDGCMKICAQSPIPRWCPCVYMYNSVPSVSQAVVEFVCLMSHPGIVGNFHLLI